MPQRFGQLQAAAGRFVDEEMRSAAILFQPDDVRKRTFLRLLHVLQEGARGGDSGRVLVEVKAVERRGAEVGQQEPPAFLARVVPGGPAGEEHAVAFDERAQDAVGKRLIGNETLGRLDAGQFIGQVLRLDVCGDETAGRKLQPRQADSAFLRKDAGQEIVAPRVEEAFIDQRSGGDDAGDLPADKPPGQLRILDLVANRHAQPGVNQLLKVVLQCVIRKPGHRHGVGRSLVAAGEREAQNPRGQLCVVMEKLVKVPHPKQEQRPRILALNLQIPLHHRGLLLGLLDRHVVPLGRK